MNVGVEMSNDCSWDAHIAKILGKGKTHVGEMDAILTDSHLDTRVKRCVLMNVIVPNIENAGENVGRECDVSKAGGNSTDDSS